MQSTRSEQLFGASILTVALPNLGICNGLNEHTVSCLSYDRLNDGVRREEEVCLLNHSDGKPMLQSVAQSYRKG